MAAALHTAGVVHRPQALRGIRVLIACADLLNLDALKQTLEQQDDLCIVGEATHWDSIAQHIDEFVPEIVFSDADLLPTALARFSDRFPLFVQVGDAKFAPSRVIASLGRAASPREICEAVDFVRIAVLETKWQEVMQMLQASRSEIAARSFADTIEVNGINGATSVPVQEIRCITAAKNYVRIETGSGEFQARAPISEICARLDPSRFLRIHRSVIVSKSEVTSLVRREGTCVGVVLRSGKRFRIGGTYRRSAVQIVGDAS